MGSKHTSASWCMRTWEASRGHGAAFRVLTVATCSACTVITGACLQWPLPSLRLSAFSSVPSPSQRLRRPVCGLPGAFAQPTAPQPLRSPRKWQIANARGLRGGQSSDQIQMAKEGYQTPVKDMVDLVDAKPSPSMSVQPSAAGAKWVLLQQPSAMLEVHTFTPLAP